ncbi:MAG: serine/threonine-protein kinase, partial [Planctomycetota bacterium]
MDQLQKLQPGNGSSAKVASAASINLQELPSLDGFQTKEIIGKGGMGVVYSAEDQELSREVAVKLLPTHKATGNRAERFRLEAEVTGGLEHPGIVPIYRMRHDEQQMWYAMRLIRGSSMRDAADAYHRDHSAEALRDLLRRLIDVCNAVGFAHSKGVLHRDLKPANIMLGEFGETIVVDWGLAKREADEPQDTRLSDSSAGQGTATQTGAIIGTPAFMSPEQANGNLSELNRASDIYSLGSTLYYILTGQNPVEGTDAPTVLMQVRQGIIRAPISVKPDTPKALNAVCMRAMATEPADRYLTMGEFAADLERFLADEAVSAFDEPVQVKARRWMRKNPAPVGVLAATILLGLVSASAIAAVVSSKNTELADANTQLDIANGELQEANTALVASNAAERKASYEAKQQEALALRQAERATNILEFVREKVLATARPIDEKGGLGTDTSIREAIDHAVANLGEQFEGDVVTEAAIRHTLGDSYFELGELEPAIEQLRKSLKLVEHLPPEETELDVRMHSLAVALNLKGELDESLALQKQIIPLRTKRLGPNHEGTLNARSSLGNFLINHGELDEALAVFQPLYEQASSLLNPNHETRISITSSYAELLLHLGRYEEALPLLADVLEVLKSTLDADNPRVASATSNYGAALYQLGRIEESIPYFEQVAESSLRTLGPEHPSTLTHANNLGRLLLSVHRDQEAVVALQPAQQAANETLGSEHILTITLKSSYADALAVTDQLQDALVAKRQAIAGAQSGLGEDHPTTIDVRGGLANLLIQSETNEEEAETILRDIIPLAKAKFGAEHPKTLNMEHNLGMAQVRGGKIEAGIELLEQVLETRRKVLPEHHPFTIESLAYLPVAYKSAGREEDACRIVEQHVASNAAYHGKNSRRFAYAIETDASLLHSIGRTDRAIELQRQCLKIREQIEPSSFELFASMVGLATLLSDAESDREPESLLLGAFAGLSEMEDNEKALKTSKEVAGLLADLYADRGE